MAANRVVKPVYAALMFIGPLLAGIAAMGRSYKPVSGLQLSASSVDVHWPAVGGHRGRNAAPTLLAEPLTLNVERRTLNAKP